jgi:hypothetical protein
MSFLLYLRRMFESLRAGVGGILCFVGDSSLLAFFYQETLVSTGGELSYGISLGGLLAATSRFSCARVLCALNPFVILAHSCKRCGRFSVSFAGGNA